MNQDQSKQAKESRTAVCIAGANRSGTSMLTRLLHSSGLDLGPESELMPAQADNPDGFWENVRFVHLNDEVLNEMGGAWDLPPPASSDFQDPRLDSLRAKARLLIEQFNSARIWGWKDPRNSLTIPFWRPLLPNLKIVIMVRNPLEVAYSMRSRNGTSYSFGLRLWEIYQRRLLEATNASERLVSHYDSFFENPERELERIARFIGLPLSSTAAAALVNRTRRHTHFTTDQLIDAGLSTKVVELYQELIDEARRAISGSSQPAGTNTGSTTDSTHSAELLPGAISRLNVSIPNAENVRRDLARLRDEIERLNRELAHRDGRITELQETVVRLDQQRNQERMTLLNQTKELAARAAVLDTENQQIRNRFLQTNQLLQSNSISLAENEERVVELTLGLRHQLHSVRRLSRLLNDVNAAAARLRSSRRWKIANPIAALRATFSGKRALAGYGHLERVVSAYSAWRSKHPEVDKIDDALQSLSPRDRQPAVSVPESDSSPNGRRFEPQVPSMPIAFPAGDEVEVSIIIPVYNHSNFTLACLDSIAKHTGDVSYEVIVVDDCSSDNTPELMRQVGNLVYVRADENAGFIASCNRGAQAARGKYLVFLNNDTTVTPDWLSQLLATYTFEPEAGIVGSKLIYPDGKLQEAGGIIWRDGSGWNRGKYQDPATPEYNYLKEMDYCSGASIMIPRTLFRELGGFDVKYAPGYYEDVDLCFKARRAGYKVLYQPLSVVVHYEGVTGGTDTSTGAKQYQTVNRATLVSTWAQELAERPASGDLEAYYSLPPDKQRILVVDHHLPMPEKDAGSLRMFYILVILTELGHKVTFIPDNLANIPPYSDELQKRGIEVVFYPYLKSIKDYLAAHGQSFDTIILSRCDFARKHIADARNLAPASRIIFDTVDLHHLRHQREALLTGEAKAHALAAEKEKQEFALIDAADETWVVSSAEQDLLKKQRPDKCFQVVPTIVEIAGSATPFSLRRDFIFIGSFQHTPNADAVCFFAREILPLVHKELPEAKFFIIGAKPPPEVVAFANEKVVVTGLQPDLRPYLDNAKLSVAPLRFGAGVKGKINHSMSFGVPVVATSLAVEGMNLHHRKEIMIADQPEEFAAALIELYHSESLWNQLSKAGLEHTREHYSKEAAKEMLARVFSKGAKVLAPAPEVAEAIQA